MHVVVIGSRDRSRSFPTEALLPPTLVTEASRVAAAGAFAPFEHAVELVATLDQTFRGDDLVLGVLLDRAPSQRSLAANRCLELARADRYGVAVAAPPHDPRGPALSSALAMAASIMRRRTPAMWEALDVLGEIDGTSANRAAALLGCSGQAIRERRLRAHHAATADLEPLLAHVLAAPAPTASSGQRPDGPTSLAGRRAPTDHL